MKSNLSLITVVMFIFSANLALAQEDLRKDLKEYGNQFSKMISQRASWWVSGGELIPSFVANPPKEATLQSNIDATTINTATPVENNGVSFQTGQAYSKEDIEKYTEMLGSQYQLRGKFHQRISNEIVSGRIGDEYNFFITESRRIGCWRNDTPYAEQCKELQELGVGVFLALYLNQDVLGSPSIPVDKTLKALGKFLVGENISSNLKAGIYSMIFSADPDPVVLVNLGYLLNENSNVFKNFSSGSLTTSSDFSDLIKEEQKTQRNNIINLFRNSVDTLQTVLNDKKRGWEYAAPAAMRLEALKDPLKLILEKFPEDKFSVKEFYSGLGILHQYYESQAEFVSLDHLKQFRGDLRSEFADLTESKIERWLLWIWGALSGYGTSITGLTITLFALLIGVLILSLASAKSTSSQNCFLHGLECCLRVLTIRGKESDFWGVRWLVLMVEAFLFLFIPTYLGFVVTFLLRAS